MKALGIHYDRILQSAAADLRVFVPVHWIHTCLLWWPLFMDLCFLSAALCYGAMYFCAPLTASNKNRNPLLTKHQFLRHSAQVPEKAHQSRDQGAWTKLGRSDIISVDMNRSGPHLGLFRVQALRILYDCTLWSAAVDLRIFVPVLHWTYTILLRWPLFMDLCFLSEALCYEAMQFCARPTTLNKNKNPAR